MDYQKFFQASIDKLKTEERYRIFATLERQVGNFPQAKNHKHISKNEVTVWCSNDYLGMGQHPKVLKAMHDAIDSLGAGAGGTRNISGTTYKHVELEKEIADLHDKDSALIFTSGYVANETTLCTLGKYIPNLAIYSDSLNHASMIEGIRNSRAEKFVFNHNDVDHLESLLKEQDIDRPKLIAFESVYSMDGDIAPIHDICKVAKKYNALTYLDEVHGVGMYGYKGGGVAQMVNASNSVDIIQGTFGKAIGTIGGYIAASAELVDFVRSYAAGFIFTTALPPAIVAGTIASIQHLKTSSTEREIHQARAALLKRKLSDANLPYLPSPSHIVPVIVGDAMLCKMASDILMNEYSIYVQPINYPTVPRGSERLRLAPTPLHTEAMIDDLVNAFADIWQRLTIKLAA